MMVLITTKLLGVCLLLELSLCNAWSPGRGTEVLKNNRRRSMIQSLVVAVGGSMVLAPDAAKASNLPASTGADQSRTGTIETLIPIVQLKKTLATTEKTLQQSSGALQQTQQALSSIPTVEQDFKRLFDQYSDPVSYKQKYLDQNAFLVYYTKGFDGPGRPSIESGDNNEIQTLQFGARNEAWVAWDAVQAELAFALAHPDDSSDLIELVQAASKAIDSYLSLAPSKDLDAATKQALMR